MVQDLTAHSIGQLVQANPVRVPTLSSGMMPTSIDRRPSAGSGHNGGVEKMPFVQPHQNHVDFTWNSNQNNDNEEDSFAVHFSIGMAF